MPRVFLYEYITGGGLWSAAGSPPPAGSLLVEGEAMRRALASDFSSAGWSVLSLRDARIAAFESKAREVSSAIDERRLFEEAASAADATLIIAPELAGALLTRVRWAEAAGAKLISPGAEFVALAADKQLCCQRLQAAGIAVPAGVELAAGDPLPGRFRHGAVLKPVDGAGSTSVRIVREPPPTTLRAAAVQGAAPSDHRRWRLEEFCPGAPASIAVLAGPAGSIVLPACRQRLSDDDSLAYLGGECPLPLELAARAESLAKRVVAAMPPTQGYFGIDLVLGASAREDVVIEINPRLTTSYVGLRRLVNENLAAAMATIAASGEFALSFKATGLEFDAGGEVREFDSTRRQESRA